MATVLIVEDEEPIRNLLTRVIQREGHRVVSAGDGDTGLLLARDEKPDLIVSDLTLPSEPSGVFLVRALHAVCPGAPIVVATGRAVPEDHAALLAVGVKQILMKPFDLATVRGLLLKMLNPTPPAT